MSLSRQTRCEHWGVCHCLVLLFRHLQLNTYEALFSIWPPMSSYNARYRGESRKQPDRSAILENARAARSRRAPRQFRQFYRENNAPWASNEDRETAYTDTQRLGTTPASYFFRARKLPSSAMSKLMHPPKLNADTSQPVRQVSKKNTTYRYSKVNLTDGRP